MGTGPWTPPLDAGRRPAGAALLGWLADPRAPRLCLVSGGPGAGKSHLLGWLLAHGTAPGAPVERRVHAALPSAGIDVRGALWLLGSQLGITARTVPELLAALAGDDRRTVICVPELDRAADPGRLVAELLDPMLELPHLRLVVEAAPEVAFANVTAPAVLDLDDPAWTDRGRFEAWCAKEGHDPNGYPSPGRAAGSALPTPQSAPELIARVPRGADGALDLAAAGEDLLSDLWLAAARAGDLGPLATDPLLYALARPTSVTTALAGRTDPLATAWSAVGPALVDIPDAPGRAHLLRARLLGTDPAAAARLADAPSPWAVRWARWEPGAVAAAVQGGHWLVADRNGTIRRLAAFDGSMVGVVPVGEPRPLQAITVTAGGSLVMLDTWSGTELLAPTSPAPGLEPFDLDEALARLRSAAGPLTALAAEPQLPAAAPAVGDAAGAVHWYEGGEVRSVPLHTGPVTALAAHALGTGQDAFPLLASGGYDGAVRLWGPDDDPMPGPADRRPAPVTALALASDGSAGLLLATAWSDGLIRVRRLELPGRPVELRLGSDVRTLGFANGALLVGLTDGLLAVDLLPG
ncbi:hypothetical protein [Kitasatospora sp. NPDC059673]|uniref:hypothetical protein n=1 Tax=Kitasatospora sp. NPDC059673 TaxID=3346901 RepID=UPI003691F48E